MGRIEPTGPAPDGGGIGQAIRTFECRHRLFPGPMVKIPPLQGVTTRQQAVVRVREGKTRQEGKGLPATTAPSATDLDPIVVLIMCLL